MAKTFIGELILRLKDEMSGKAKEAASNLDSSVERIQKAAARMNKTSWGGSFEEKLRRLGASSSDIDKLRTSWEHLNKTLSEKDLSKAAQAMEKANFKNASLGVFAELAAKADKAESSISKMHNSIKAAMKDMVVWSTTGAVMYGGVEAVRGGIEANAEFVREKSRWKQANIPDKERDAAITESDRLTTLYPSANIVNAIELARKSRAMMGTSERGLAILPDLVKAFVALQSAKGTEAATRELEGFLKGADVAGINRPGQAGIDDVRAVLAGWVKAAQVEGTDLDTAKFLEFARYGKLAVPGLSNRFLGVTVPAISQDYGPSQFGNALNMAYKAFVVGSNSVAGKKNLEAQRDLGIRAGEDNGGKGHLVDDQLFGADPYEWVKQVLIPALEKKGVDTNNNVEVTKAIANLTSNSNAATVLTRMVTQQKQIDRLLEQYDAAKGLEFADTAAAQDPFVSWRGFVESWKELATSIKGMPEAVAGLNMLTAGIQKFSTALRNDSGLAQLTLAGAGAAGLVGAWKMAAGLWNLTTAGTSLQHAAASLEAAALSLKGASATNGPGNSAKPGATNNTSLFGGAGMIGTLLNFVATAVEDVPSTAEEWAKNRKLVADRDKRISDWLEKNIGTPRTWFGLDRREIDLSALANRSGSPDEREERWRLKDPYQNALEIMNQRQLMEGFTKKTDPNTPGIKDLFDQHKGDEPLTFSNPFEGVNLGGKVSNIVYELMKPTRDRLFAEIPVDKGKQQADQTTTAAVPPTIDLSAAADEAAQRRRQMEQETTPYNPNTPNVSQYFEQPAAAEQKPVIIDHQPADDRTAAAYQQNADSRQAAGVSSNPQVRPEVDMSAIDAAAAAAQAVGQQIIQGLAVTGSPQVNLAALQQALSMVNAINAGLSRMSGAIQQAHASVGHEMRRNFADYGVSP